MEKVERDIGSKYLHGTDPEEQRRLTRMNELMNARCLAEIRPVAGGRILDVGCGLGQLTRAMARIAGSGLAVGVERSDKQLAEANRQASAAGESDLVEFRAGDANRLPLAESEWHSFDLVHARFLLEHVPDPLETVRGMVQAAKPGGRIVLEDDDHGILTLWPEPPGVMPIWQAYIRSYDRLGNDPYIGRRLVSLLHLAGAEPVRNTWIFFGSCSGDPDLAAFVENTAHLLIGAKSTIQAATQLSDADFEAGIASLRDWSLRPDAALWFAIAFAEGRRPS